MSGIRTKHTKPEILVRKALFLQGYRFRLHRKDLPGAPDIVMAGRRIAIFVHGCFWHMHAGCRFAKIPSTRTEFWLNKLQGNVARDQRAIATLLESGWRVLTVWECATRNPDILENLPQALTSWVEGTDSTGEVSEQYSFNKS